MRAARWLGPCRVLVCVGALGCVARVDRLSYVFEIRPPLAPADCFERLPTAGEVPEETDFPALVERGRVGLEHARFDAQCIQRVRVAFASRAEYEALLEGMDPCPQYPFRSAADYQLQTALFVRAALHRDLAAYRILLRKDGRCASELNPRLYSILREKPNVFLEAFAELGPAEQVVAAETQYDFNRPLSDQRIPVEAVDAELAAARERFDALLARVADRHE